MHIARIVIRNFKNFHLLDCPIQSGVTCVLGENNAGKSNLLHALRLALDINLPSNLRHLTENDVHCCTALNVAQQVLVSVEFTAYSATPEQCAMCGLWEVSNDRARVTYRFRPRQAVREAIARRERTPDSLTTEDYSWELTGGSSGEGSDPAVVTWDQPCGQAIKFQELQAFKIDFLPALRDVENDLRHSRLSPLSRLLTVLDIPQAEKEALVEIIRDANDDVESSPTIHTAGTAANNAFADTAGDAFKMPLRLGMIAPTFYSISRNLTVLLTNGPVVDFEPSRNGLGLNNVLYVSMLLEYFRRRITRPDTAGQLLLIEEPEAHIHPQLQHVLFSKLRDSAFQTIVTTHSTHISSAASLGSLLFLTNLAPGVTSGAVASAIPTLQSKDQADLERYLDATRSNLLFARKVMLVEGPAELFLIPPLVKKVMGIDLERQGISVVAIHGVHFSAYAKLFCAEGLRKKCALVTDGDLAPSDSISGDNNNGEDNPVITRIEDLVAFENSFLKVFACRTTFERMLALPGLLEMLKATCEELGAPRITEKLANAIFELLLADEFEDVTPILEGLDTSVLNTSKRFGKARFAQIASKHVESATELPEYIRDAVNWLMEV
jgi:putative ATP-dependent endonuclease of OLD family